ncbi:MAG: dihydroorotate dehydrogenase [Candidatus Sericytochromatia bacterium]|nr:dihydroorotate dehydrogenase [Candidatus Sericytochromatia bacterium]
MVTALQPDLAVTLGPLRLRSPLTLASGTCGYGLELAPFLDLKRVGAVFTKGLSPLPRPGHAGLRGAEVEAGMLNRIGLQNVGLEAFLAEKLPALQAADLPAIANLAGASLIEYEAMAERLDEAPGLLGLELNVSCPNVTHGGIEFGRDPQVLEGLVRAVRRRTRLPLVVKLAPRADDVGEFARAAEAAGADVLSAINTLPGLAVTPRLVDGRLTAELLRGGLSGPALRPLALRCVAEARRACRLPIIGIGGVASLEDVLAFFAVGARAVQVGTGSFVEPGLAGRLAQELADWLRAGGGDRLEACFPEEVPTW